MDDKGIFMYAMRIGFDMTGMSLSVSLYDRALSLSVNLWYSFHHFISSHCCSGQSVEDVFEELKRGSSHEDNPVTIILQWITQVQ